MTVRKSQIIWTGRRSVTIPGGKLPSGTHSVMVSTLAVMNWNLTIFTRQGEIFLFFPLTRECKLFVVVVRNGLN